MENIQQGDESNEFNNEVLQNPGQTAIEVRELKEVFDLFDFEGKGEIDPHDILGCMKTLGIEDPNLIDIDQDSPLKQRNMTKKSFYSKLVSETLKNESERKITFNKFLEFITGRHIEINFDDKEQIYEAFNSFLDKAKEKKNNIKKKNYIEVEDLREICKEIGENFDDNFIEEMIRRACKPGSSKVYKDDFYNIITLKREY